MPRGRFSASREDFTGVYRGQVMQADSTSIPFASDVVAEVHELSRQFGRTLALDRITLAIRPGLVYGLVGSNGAGKSTLIRHLLGLMRAQQGTVRVFGLDPVTHPVEVLGRVGYLSEERDLPDWMSVAELLNYSSAFYPSWDHDYAAALLEIDDVTAELLPLALVGAEVRDVVEGQLAAHRASACATAAAPFATRSRSSAATGSSGMP